MAKKQKNNKDRPTTALAARREALRDLLKDPYVRESLKAVAAKHLTPERVTKMVLLAVSRQPLLLQCTKESILKAAMTSAELGLDCSGTLGRAYLVPYRNNKTNTYECQFIAGYQGLKELALRNSSVIKIEAHTVHEKDVFEIEYGLHQKLCHRPCLDADKGKVKAAYAFAELQNGSALVEVMSVSEINKIRQRSKAKDSGPWATDYSEMARKTTVRRLCKYLPTLNQDLEKAIEADDSQFDGAVFDISGVSSAEQPKSGVENTKAKIIGSKESPKKTETEQAPVAEPSETQEKALQYSCRACNRDFEQPRDNKCPHCFSLKIAKKTETIAETQE